MPLPNIPVPPFPNIPQVPGVPPIPRGLPNLNLPTPSPMSFDSPTLPANKAAAQWGIFTAGGGSVIVGDNVSAFDYRGEERISDFPIEGGLFASYNKVKVPYDARMTFTKGGTESERTAFLMQCAQALASLDLYVLVTPEVTYANANVVGFDYRRTSENGATLLTVEVLTQEVRVSAAPTFTQTASPSNASPVNDGAVQPAPPTNDQAGAAAVGAG